MARPAKEGPELTPREVKFIQQLAKTGSQTEAALRSADGPITRKSAGVMGSVMTAKIRRKMPGMLARLGIRFDDVIRNVLEPGLRATKKVRYVHQGVVIEEREDVDYTERREHAALYLKLIGAFPAREDNLQGPAGGGGGITINLSFLDSREATRVLDAAPERTGSSDPGRPLLDDGTHEDKG
jgi:hypothetical protein